MPDAKPKTPRAAVLPKCIAILLAESVHRDKNEYTLDIKNMFHSLSAEKFPCRFPRFAIIYTLTGGHGSYDTEVAMVHAATDKQIVSVKQKIKLANPSVIHDWTMTMENTPFPVPGKYWIEVRCNGEIIGQRPFFMENNHLSDPPPQLL